MDTQCKYQHSYKTGSHRRFEDRSKGASHETQGAELEQCGHTQRSASSRQKFPEAGEQTPAPELKQHAHTLTPPISGLQKQKRFMLLSRATELLFSLPLCEPVDGSTPGFSVLHCLLDFTQTHVH